MNCNHILCKAGALAALLLAAAALARPALVQAQGAGQLGLPSLQVRAGKIKPGTWVRYQVVRRDLKQELFLELTALEREAGGQWLELAITDSYKRTTISKLLLSGHLGAPGGVLKAVVQLPGQRPLLLPDALVAEQAPPLRVGRDPQAKPLGKEPLKVPAGTFRATKYRKQDDDAGVTLLWLSEQVAGWPLVKLSSPKLLWQLAAHGDDGSSRIRGEPQKLPEGLLIPPQGK